ncbi:MAG: 1-acyl-sn-glycerol-3-phosphate acyltransferase [Acidimicrobiia bacterium]
MIKPPPKILRRVLLGPAVVGAVSLAVATLPVMVPVAAFVSRYVPGKWRILRIIWFLFLYMLVNATSLVALFLLWVGSGFGWKVDSPAFMQAHYRLLAWMLRRVVASAKFTFKLTLVREGPRPRTVGQGERRPALVLSRHAGPGDSMLLMDALTNGYHRRPRIVLKEFLQWDPAIDVILNRLPCAFVPEGRKGAPVIEAIRTIAADLGPDDAFVIFPEGGNYTRWRHLRAIEKLTEMGRPDLAERAADLENTMPPRSAGVMAALEAAPPKSDVFFVGHAGLEAFLGMGDIWRGMPMDTRVAVKIWPCPAESIPPAGEQEDWLYDMWAEIDEWITARLADTAEPFDDPAAY